MIRKTQRMILSEMQQVAADMARYDDLYNRFRKIRHDFANYIQSSQFESEDEAFILRLRVLKKSTLEDTNALLADLGRVPFDLSCPQPEKMYPLLAKDTGLLQPHTEKEKVLFAFFEDIKPYFTAQQQELSVMWEVLLHLKDRLERSLPPDEEESREHLAECDAISCHMTADTVLLAAYTYRFKQDAEALGADFRFRIAVPECLEKEPGDLYFLLGAAKQRVLAYLEEKKSQDPRSGEQTPYKVRLSMAVGMGLWHFSLEYGKSEDRGEDGILLPDAPVSDAADPVSEQKAPLFSFFQKEKPPLLSPRDPELRRILKRHKARMGLEENRRIVKIDVVG